MLKQLAALRQSNVNTKGNFSEMFYNAAIQSKTWMYFAFATSYWAVQRTRCLYSGV